MDKKPSTTDPFFAASFMSSIQDVGNHHATVQNYPHFYQVILRYDTSLPNAVSTTILKDFFHQNTNALINDNNFRDNMQSIMCGIYPHDIAETKINEVMEFARQHYFSLQCIMQKDG